MVVVAIVGIAAGLGLASLSPIAADVRLHGTARGTAALIRTARVHALTHHARVRVTVSGPTILLESCAAKYGIIGSCANAGAFAALPNQTVVVGTGDATSVKLVNSPATAVTFGSDGLPEGTPVQREFEFSNGQRTSRVVVTPAGEVRIL